MTAIKDTKEKIIKCLVEGDLREEIYPDEYEFILEGYLNGPYDETVVETLEDLKTTKKLTEWYREMELPELLKLLEIYTDMCIMMMEFEKDD